MASNNRGNRAGTSGRRKWGEPARGQGSSGTFRNSSGGAGGSDHGPVARSADPVDYTDAAQERQSRATSFHGSTSRNLYVSRGGQRRDAGSTLHEVEDLVPPASESAEQRERESSPSAVSESSSVRLEWDSSADVGSLSITGNTGSTGRPAHSGRTYSMGLSSLERIASQLSSGSSGASNIEQQLEPPSRTTLSTTSTSVTGQAEPILEERRGGISSSVTKGPPSTFLHPKSSSKSSKQPPAPAQHKPMSVWVLGRSHSQEEEHPEQGRSLDRVKSVSMIELATGGRMSDQPILLQPSAISNIKNRNKRETSSRDSVTTVLSSKKFDMDKPENEEDLARAHSTPSSSPITAVSPAHSPVSSSVPPMPTSHSLSNPSSEHQQHRSRRSREKLKSQDPGQESSEDMEVAKKLQEDKENPQLTQNRGVSEASTDWEYGSRSHTPNESSFSDWQHSGVTQSEAKYKSKIQIPATDNEKSSAYSLTVEMPKSKSREIDAEKHRRGDVTARIQQSRGVQTEDFISSERGPSIAQKKSGKVRKDSEPHARVSKSVQTHEDMLELSRMTSGTESTNGIKTGTSFEEQTNSSSSSKANGKNVKHRDSKSGTDRKGRSRNTEGKQEIRHRGPRHYRARQEDKENHHCRAAHDRKDEVESLLEEFVTSEEDLRTVDDDGSLSSDMSATCLKIQELLKSHPFRGKLLELVFAHHLSHLRALKKDIRRVRQMNRIIVDADQLDLQEESGSYSSTKSSEDPHLKLGKHYYKQLEKPIGAEMEIKQAEKHKTRHRIPETKSPSLKLHPDKRKHDYSEHVQRESPTSSSSSAATYSISGDRNHTSSSRTSPEYSSEAFAVHEQANVSGTQGHRQTHSVPPKTNSANKLDQLQRTCDIITDLLILNQGLEPIPKVASSQFHMQTRAEQVHESHSARESKGKHRRTSSGAERGHLSVTKTLQNKQAYSFFVSFPNCKPCNGFESTPQYPNECPGKTLQEAFQENHPDALARVKARQEIIQRIKKEREIRGKLKREYIQSHGHQNGKFSSLQKILPPKGPRVMSSREMRDLTNKHYQKLPEVQEKKLMEMMEREKQTNRIVSQLYAKRVKQEALRGKVNLGLSKSVIRK